MSSLREELVFNGDRLKKARIYRGFTVAELAEHLDCQRQTVSMYENKKIDNPDSTIVNRMSDILKFPKKYFYEKDNSINIGSTYFRALLTTNKKYRNEQIQKMEFVSNIFAFIKEYIDFPQLDLPSISTTSTPEEAAELLRDKWNLGRRPIENLIFETEQKGIVITSFETATDNIDAFSQMIDINGDDIFTIGYSSNKTSAARLHFDIAHELGHICMHEWSEDIEILSKEEFKERENEANQFASAFLLPKDTFYFDVKQNPTSIPYYIELKKKWKVSIAAMIRRAYTLAVISYEEYQSLMRVLQRRGMRKEEPLDNVLTTAQPSLLKTAVQMLLSEKVFTAKEFIDELSFSYNLTLYPNEIEHLLGLPVGTLKIDNVIPLHNLQLKN
ncbi:helix-turn-helix domain-containing protein [Faecalispora anaeroviscerum]|uniref:helix-turn-helix domain-containing protein n=1 Tax=Faecalispora anaeroviscerum TaxID=2991836 RepID=UPI0024B91D3E|nr:XRE family transcriptional regulator [Faecalispora anaeroviscerum]